MKKRMLILTGLFFNKEGNQSLLESVRGFSKEFEIDLVTVADLHDHFFYRREEIKSSLPTISIFAPKMPFTFLIKTLRNYFRRLRIEKSEDNKNEDLDNMRSLLVNANVNFGSRIMFTLREYHIYFAARKLMMRKKSTFDTVVAYEINAIRPALKLKEKLLPNAKVIGKFQGTVLGSVIDNEKRVNENQVFWADTRALSSAYKLDGCLMTNDGTRGKEVLQNYGVRSDRILFFPNGVSKLCKDKQKEVRESKRLLSYPINLFTLSRLIYWKRVDLGPKIISMLVNKFDNKNFHLTIFGAGNTEDVRRMRATIKEYNVSDYVDYSGPVPYEKTTEIFASYDILLSLYIMNNITNPLLEAVFYGIPVMTIYKADLAELIGERVKGCIMLKDSENEKELIQQAAEQLNNTDIGRLQEMYSFMENGSTNIGTWDQRMSKELDFIRNLKR